MKHDRKKTYHANIREILSDCEGETRERRDFRPKLRKNRSEAVIFSPFEDPAKVEGKDRHKIRRRDRS